MKKLLIISVLAIFSITAFSQDKAADLKKLIKLMDSEKMIDNMMNSLVPALQQQTAGQIQGDSAKQKMEQYIKFMMSEVKTMTIRLVNEDMVQIYDKHFTQQEIKDLINFYESPTGKKMLAKTPEISSDLMNIMMAKYLPEFREKLMKKLNELK
jgi:hypothetical protein